MSRYHLPHGRISDVAANRARAQMLSELADQGLNMGAAAAALGISRPSLTQWFNAHGHDVLRQRLKDNRSSVSVSAEEARRRLLTVRRAPSQAAAARELGLTQSGLHHWLKRWAPWGVQDALGDWI